MENGQDKASVLDHLDHCCQLVSEKYGKPDAVHWTNSDFIRLSSILYRQTQVQISPNTLKRIFGKIKTDARYYPQKATRDSLARYAGFADWDTFTHAQLLPLPELNAAASGSYGDIAVPFRQPTPTLPAGPSGEFPRLRPGIFAGLTLIIIVGLAWIGKLLLTKEEPAVTFFAETRRVAIRIRQYLC
ncbi:hypothetical protein LZD49_28025 [Dyadobacter sp. CY261]|uniref:hypothetical protein n=1 Tax=Dyadobacter sp. CY261 TaxID=2907203 RepID=UPI001F3ADA3D|nr:hypothetical protein [Dyadobacter sp. CY261]MCF0074364.1 hypothetical protein [Dyadobacter sp. CY261]